MDPQTDLPDLVEDLEVNIDELTTALEPLLATPLHTTASSLPLLDKAEFYCMSAYAVEAILFSVLKASGVNAMEHDVFKEIARLKQYNSKIKDIKDRGIMGSAEGRARLDVGAAQRFIKHGLAGNDKYDLERQERIAKEKARAHLKAQKINKKFDDEGKEMEYKDATPKKRAVGEVDDQQEYSDDEVMEGLEEAEPATKKARVTSADGTEIDSEATSSSQTTSKKQKKETKAKKSKTKKAGKKATQSAESTEADADNKEDDSKSQAEPSPEIDTPQPKKRGRPPKKDKKAAAAPKANNKQDSDTIDVVATPTQQDTDVEATPSRAEERVTRRRNTRLSTQNLLQDEESVVPTPDDAPKTRSETFTALLDGSLSEKQKKGKTGGRGGKRGGKGRGK
ncbi:putative hepatoma-derived growth factor-related protein 2-like [Alternaria sp. MG1]|jgi:exosome complex protein LRP1|nr:putative hepatoma-derived growth factor-related protein 2-like [Alternaria sp. MG1]